MNRWLGALILLIAVLSWVICLAGWVGLWVVQPDLAKTSTDTLAGLRKTVNTTSTLLGWIDSAMSTTQEDILLLQTSLKDIARALEKTSPMLRSAGDMVGGDFTRITRDSRNTLLALKTSAKLVEDSLRLLSQVPFIGIPYNPPVPLDTSIGNMADSLAAMPDNLSKIQTWLASSATDLDTLQKDTNRMAASVGQINADLKGIQDSLTQERAMLSDMDLKLAALEKNLPDYLQWGSWAAALLLLWIAAGQISSFVVGLDRLTAKTPDHSSNRVI